MKINYVFFGTDTFAVTVLNTLEKQGIIPQIIITVPDTIQGKKQLLTPPLAKTWALEHNIPILQPEKLDDGFTSQLKAYSPELSVVASYGKIIPQSILDIPTRKTLNIHPSLLPEFRGSSPLEYAILHKETTGVTIMRLDSKMDHGPVVAQEISEITLPVRRDILEEKLATQGALLLAEILPDWINESIIEQEQEHIKATFTEKIKKEDGLLDLSKPKEAYRKFCAFTGWPGSFFFMERNGKNIRIIVTDATLSETGDFIITEVKPEGKKEMSYEDFLKGNR